MRELSLHILDIAENGLAAGADLIRVTIREDMPQDILQIEIEDNGRGIPPDILANVSDPFVTSRTTRRVGMGIPLLKAGAERCEGTFTIASRLGEGTRVAAQFKHSHIDRAPLGDIGGTLTTLMVGNPHVDFVYTHVINGDEFVLDTREIKSELGQEALADPVVVYRLGESLTAALRKMYEV